MGRKTESNKRIRLLLFKTCSVHYPHSLAQGERALNMSCSYKNAPSFKKETGVGGVEEKTAQAPSHISRRRVDWGQPLLHILTPLLITTVLPFPWHFLCYSPFHYQCHPWSLSITLWRCYSQQHQPLCGCCEVICWGHCSDSWSVFSISWELCKHPQIRATPQTMWVRLTSIK